MVAIISGQALGIANSSANILGAQGQFGSALTGSKKEAAYINIATGNLTLQDNDDFLSSHANVNVNMARTYNSQGTFDDGNGHGWKLGLYKRLSNLTGNVNTVGSTITRIDGDGSSSVYTYDSVSKTYTTTDGAGAFKSLSYSNDGSGEWVWLDTQKTNDAVHEIYDGKNNFRIIALRKNGVDQQRYSYNTYNQLAEVRDTSGDLVTYEYDAGNHLLVDIKSHLGDTNQDVTRVRYTYDNLNRMKTCVTDLTPDNTSDTKTYTTQYDYEGDSDRIAMVRQDDGSRITFKWEQFNGVWKVKSFTNALGALTQFDYSVVGKTKVIDPLNNETTYCYDNKGQLTSVISPTVNGFAPTTIYSYDENNGNLKSISVKLDANSSLDTVYKYDANGNRILERDAAGNTIVRRYDLTSNLLRSESRYLVPDPDGDTVNGASAQGPLTTRYVYDADGRLAFTISAEGRVTEFNYDSNFALCRSFQYNGNLFDVSSYAMDATPSWATMKAWHSSAAIDFNRVILTEYVRGLRNEVAAQKQYTAVDSNFNGDPTTVSTTRFYYDQTGALIKKIDANSNVTSYAYDGLGRLIGSTDANKNAMTTDIAESITGEKIASIKAPGYLDISTFDAAGNLISIDHQFGGKSESLTRYVYDANNRVRMTQNATGQRQYYLYDALGRKSAEIDRDGSLTEFFYDNASRLNRVTRYATRINPSPLLDANDQPKEVAVATLRPAASNDDRTSWNVYDKANRLYQTVDAEGDLTTFEYDGLSRLVKTTQSALAVSFSQSDVATGVVAKTHYLDRISRNFYDKDSKLTHTIDADGFLRKNEYDPSGKLIATTTYANALPSNLQTESLPSFLQALTLDAAKDSVQRYIYNNKGQLVGTVDGENYLTETTYDKVGNVESKIRYAKVVSNPGSQLLSQVGKTVDSANDQTTRYSYTALNQLKDQLDADGTLTRYSYDNLGQITLIERGSSTKFERSNAMRYDHLGNVIAELSAEGVAKLAEANADVEKIWKDYAVSYTYTATGLRTSMVDQNNHRTLYYYNADGQLAYTINAIGEVQENLYNAFNQVEKTRLIDARLSDASLATLSGGIVNAQLTSALGQMAKGDDNVSTTIFNKIGLVKDQVDGRGFHTKMTYDAFGDVMSRARQIELNTEKYITTGYRYDNRGNLSRTLPFNNIDLRDLTSYDAFGRAYSQLENSGAEHLTSFDRVGNVIALKDPLTPAAIMKYDAFARITKRIDAFGKETSYEYDVQAHSLTITTPEQVKHITTKNRFGETVTVSDNEGNSTKYEYDLNGKLLKVFDTNNKLLSQNVYDRAGLLTDSTDANGVTTHFEYDALNRVFKKTAAYNTPLAQTTTFTYVGRVLTTVDATGTATVTTYDKNGQVSSVLVDPTGLKLLTKFEYDGRGTQILVTDPNGNSTVYGKGETSFTTSSQNASANLRVQTFYNDETAGRDMLLRVVGSAGQEVSTRYVYDKNHRLQFEVDGEGNITGYSYDANNRLTKTTRYANKSKLITPGLDPYKRFTLNEITASVYPDARNDVVIRTVYDLDGRVYAQIDGTGTVTVNQKMDGEGRVTHRVTYAKALTNLPDNASKADLIAALAQNGITLDGAAQQRTVYDAHGNASFVMTATASSNSTSSWTVVSQSFDLMNNLVASTSFAKSLASNNPQTDVQAWVANSANSSEADNSTRLVYDKANRVIAIANKARNIDSGKAEWSVISNQYDNDNNLVARIALVKPLQQAANQAIGEQQLLAFINDASNYSNNDAQTRFVYDAANRLLATAKAIGTNANQAVQWAVSRNVYDSAGNVIKSTAYANTLSSALLPANASLEAIKQWLLTSVASDANRDNSVRRFYNSANKLQFEVDALGYITEYSYTSQGQVNSTTRYPEAKVVSDTAQTNDLKAMVALMGANPQLAVQLVTYDKAGNAVRILNRLKADANNKAQWSLTTQSFDSRGNLIAKNSYSRVLDGSKLVDANKPSSSEIATWISANDDAMDAKQRYVYDADNRQIASASAQKRLADGTHTWSIVSQDYDSLGNLLNRHSFLKQITANELTADSINSFIADTASSQLTDPQQHFVYDAKQRVTSIATSITQLGDTTTQWALTSQSYDALDHVVSRIQFATPLKTAIAPSNKALFDAQLATLSSDSSNDKLERFAYDSASHMVLAVDASGAVSRNIYDALGNRVQAIRYANRFTAQSGQLTLTMAPASSAGDRVSRMVYDSMQRQIMTIDALGNVTEQRYDAQNNSIAQIQYANAIDTSKLAEVAKPADITPVADASLDRVQRSIYDRDGNLIYSVAANGSFTQFVRDAQGQVRQQTTYRDIIAANDATTLADFDKFTNVASKVRFDYDAQGHLLSKVDANGDGKDKIEFFMLDALGNKLSYTITDGQLLKAFTNYEYDAAGRVVREIAPEVEVANVSVNQVADGQWSFSQQILTKARLVTVTTYDALGNVKSRTEGDGMVDDNGKSIARTTSYQYDARNHQVLTILPSVQVYNANENALQTNAASETVRSESSKTLSIAVTYDVFGNAVKNVDVGGRASFKSYDELGALRWEVDALGFVTGYQRNAFGDVTQLTRYANPTSVAFDLRSDNVSLTRWARDNPSGLDRTLETQYDKLGRAVKVIEPIAYSYDSSVDDKGISNIYKYLRKTTQKTYNAAGDVIKEAVYGADELGVAQTVVRESYHYFDRAGQEVALMNVIGNDAGSKRAYLSTKSYNAVGDLLDVTEYAEAVVMDADALASRRVNLPASNALDRSVSYGWDAHHNKISETRKNVRYIGADGNETIGDLSTTFQYDVFGNQTMVTDPLQNKTMQSFDVLGHVTAIAKFNGGADKRGQLTCLRYDVYGNVVSKSEYAMGSKIDAPFVALQSDPKDRYTVNQYDNLGHLLRSVDAEGHASFNSWDEFGRITKHWQRVTTDSGKQTQFNITQYDELGRVIDVATSDVSQDDNFQNVAGLSHQGRRYNAFGELTAKTVTDRTHNNVEYASYKYDLAGHLWFTNDGGEGAGAVNVDQVQLFNAFGEVSAHIRSPGVPLAGLSSAADALAFSNDLLRTNTRYDLLGRVVNNSVSNNDKLEIVQRDANGTWSRKQQSSASGVQDAMLLVGDSGDKGKTVILNYRKADSAVWINGSSQRLSWQGDNLVFNTSGLATGDYEYQVLLQAPNAAAPVMRETVKLHIEATPSRAQQERVVQLYNLLLNRAPSLQELNNCVLQLNDGMTMLQFIRNFLTSPETKQRFSYPNNWLPTATDIVEQSYSVDPFHETPTDAATLDKIKNQTDQFNHATEFIKTLFRDAFDRTENAGDPTFAADVDKWRKRFVIPLGSLQDNWVYGIYDLLIDSTSGNPGNAANPANLASSRFTNRVAAVLNYIATFVGTDNAKLQQVWDAAQSNLSDALNSGQTAGQEENWPNQISALYVGLFGRAVEKSALENNLARLRDKSITIEEIAQNLLRSDEARSIGIYAADSGNLIANMAVIQRLYVTFLETPASQGELDYWLGLMNRTVDRQTIGGVVMNLLTTIATYRGDAWRNVKGRNTLNNRTAIGLAFAKVDIADPNQIYVFSRTIMSAVGAQTNVAQAMIGLKDRLATIVNAMKQSADNVNSAMSTLTLENMRFQISRLYVTLFNRAADQTGMQNWLKAWNNIGGKPDGIYQIAKDMLKSNEAQALFPSNISIEAVVRQGYQQVLGRQPNVSELSYLLPKYQGKENSYVVVDLLNMFANLELSTLQPERPALELFNNKVAVSTEFAIDLLGENWQVARDLMGKVTAFDTSAALAYARQQAETSAKQAADTALAALRLSENLNNSLLLATQEALSQSQPLPSSLQPGADYLASAEGRAYLVARLYVGVLRRGPGDATPLDLNGLHNLSQSLAQGNSEEAIAQMMIDSEEGKAIYGAASSFSATDFVRSFYRNSIGREADAAGLLYWQGQLTNANLRGKVAVAMLRQFLDTEISDSLPTKGEELTLRAAFMTRLSNALGIAASAAKAVANNVLPQVAIYQNLKAEAGSASTLDSTQSAVRRVAMFYLALFNQSIVSGTESMTAFASIVMLAVNGGSDGTLADKLLNNGSNVALSLAALNNAQFIDRICQQVLGRVSGAKEAPLLAQLANSSATRGQVAAAITKQLFSDNSVSTGEFAARAKFEQRIQDFCSSLTSAAATYRDQTTALPYQNALTALNAIEAEINRQFNDVVSPALKIYTDIQPQIKDAADALANAKTTAAQAQAYLSAPYRDLLKLFVAFKDSTDYGSVSSALTAMTANSRTLYDYASDHFACDINSSDATIAADFASQYSLVLGRSASSSELTSWVGIVKNAASKIDFVRGFVNAAYGELANSGTRPSFSTSVQSAQNSFQTQCNNKIAAVTTAQQTLDLKNQQSATAKAEFYRLADPYDKLLKEKPIAKAAMDKFEASYKFAGKLANAINPIVLLIGDEITLDQRAADLISAANVDHPRTDTVEHFAEDVKAIAIAQRDYTALDSRLAALLSLKANVANIGFAINSATNSSGVRQTLQVTQVYCAVLGRAPSYSEMLMEDVLLSHGSSLLQMAESLIKGNPTLYPANASDSDFIRAMYKAALGNISSRPDIIDAGGLAFWSARLAGSPTAPAISRAQMVLEFIQSVTITNSNSDSVLFETKVQAALAAIKSAAAQQSTQLDNFIAGNIGAANREVLSMAQTALANLAKLGVSANPANVEKAKLLAALYFTVLGRAPDIVDYALSLQGLINNSIPVSEVAMYMIISPEGLQLYENSSCVTRYFSNALGRQPTTSEANKYNTLLKTYNRGQVAVMVAQDLLNEFDAGEINALDLNARENHTEFLAKVSTTLTGLAWPAQVLATQITGMTAIGDKIIASNPIDRHLDRAQMGSSSLISNGERFSSNQMTLDRWGNVLSIVDARDPNWKTSFTYNAANQVTSTRKANGASASDTSTTYSTTAYDALGRIVATRDGNSYDASNARAYGKVSKTRYDGYKVIETHADGGDVENEYNLFGERSSVTQGKMQNGMRVTNIYEYDRLGHVSKIRNGKAVDVYKIVAAQNNVEAQDVVVVKDEDASKIALFQSFTYDELGRRISSTDTAGFTTYQAYDLDGNLTKIRKLINADGPLTYADTLYRFDSLQHKTGTMDANGLKMSWAYNDRGQMVSHRDMANNLTTYYYDNAGELIRQTAQLAFDLNQAGQSPTTAKVSGDTRQVWVNGLLMSITQKLEDGNDMISSYSYDRVGNRLTENMRYTGPSSNVPEHLQSNLLAYDAQSRLVDIRDKVGVDNAGKDRYYRISYTYDSNGNRTSLTVRSDQMKLPVPPAPKPPNPRDPQTPYPPVPDETPDLTLAKTPIVVHSERTFYNTFDEMNRQLIVDGNLENGQVTIGDGHLLDYDQAGNRISDTSMGKALVKNAQGYTIRAERGVTTEYYSYDAMGRLTNTNRDNAAVIDTSHYDKAGHVIESGLTEDARLYYNFTKALSDLGLSARRTTSSYYAAGALRRQTTWGPKPSDKDDPTERTNTFYLQNVGGYDKVGNLLGYNVIPATGDSGKNQYYSVFYQNQANLVSGFNGKIASFETYQGLQINHSGNGSILHSYNSYDAYGNLTRSNSSDDNGKVAATNSRLWYDSKGHVITKDRGNFNLIVNDRTIDIEKLNVDNVPGSTYFSLHSGSVAGSAYVVQSQGETLRSIAQNAWGDGGLWYLLADANAMQGNETLSVGQMITLPVRGGVSHNDAQSYQPFDQSQQLAGLYPQLPEPGLGNGCGEAKQFIVMVVAFAAAAYIGPKALEFVKAAALAGGFTVGATTTMIAGGLTGAATSVVTQGTAMALGLQSKFKWEDVAMGALGGAISAGIGGGPNGTGTSLVAGMDGSAVKTFLQTSFGSAFTSSVLTQGIGSALGLQHGFSWKNALAAGASAQVSQYIGDALGKTGTPDFQNAAKGFASNLAGGAVAAMIRPGAFNMANVARDAFANIIGNAIGGSLLPTPTVDNRALLNADKASYQAGDFDAYQAPSSATPTTNGASGNSYRPNYEMPFNRAPRGAVGAGFPAGEYSSNEGATASATSGKQGRFTFFSDDYDVQWNVTGRRINTAIPVANLGERFQKSDFPKDAYLTCFAGVPEADGCFYRHGLDGQDVYMAPAPYRIPTISDVRYGPVTAGTMASNFIGGVGESLWDLTVDTGFKAYDLSRVWEASKLIAISSAYNFATGSDVQVPEVKLFSSVARAHENGVSSFDMVNPFSPVDDIIGAIVNRDPNGLARIGGGLVTQTAIGGLAASKYGNVDIPIYDILARDIVANSSGGLSSINSKNYQKGSINLSENFNEFADNTGIVNFGRSESSGIKNYSKISYSSDWRNFTLDDVLNWRDFTRPIESINGSVSSNFNSISSNVGRNSVTWVVDANGAPISASGTLREYYTGAKRSSSEADAQAAAGAAGVSGDQGGHLVGHRFMLDQGQKNLFPQNGNFNTSAFKVVENDYARFISQGHEVVFNHTLGDFDNIGRPGSLNVAYEVYNINGDLVDTYSKKFSNRAGETYTRRAY